MNTTHYTIESRLMEFPPLTAYTREQVLSWLDRHETDRADVNVVVHWEEGGSLGLRGDEWYETTRRTESIAIAEEAADRALAADKQRQLAEALDKYHAGYDNELYIRACYSLPARTQGEWSFVNACVSLSDAALAVCGGQQYGSLTFDELTPEVIRFLAAFVLPQDEALELPF